MLHLTLAGNMLRAIGRNQALYDKDFIPTYPDQIFYDKVDIKFGPADKKTLESFVQVSSRNTLTQTGRTTWVNQ